jgi:hypothetical protein
MTSVLMLPMGQSLCLPFTDTNNVPAPLLAQAATRLGMTKLGFDFTILPRTTKTSPWRPIRRSKNREGFRNNLGFDAAMVGRLLDLGHLPSVLQCAFGASTLGADWLSPGGPLFVSATQLFTAAFASSRNPCPAPTKIIIMWEQGQSDCQSAAFSAAYAANFAAFTTAIRAALAPFTASTINWIVCQTSSALVLAGATAPQIAAVRAGQAAFVAGDGGNSALVDDTAFPTFDGVHLTEAGSIAQGIAVADAAATFL